MNHQPIITHPVLQNMLDKQLVRHVKQLQTRDYHEPQTSTCCNMPLNREGSYLFCSYCMEPHIEEL